LTTTEEGAILDAEGAIELMVNTPAAVLVSLVLVGSEVHPPRPIKCLAWLRTRALKASITMESMQAKSSTIHPERKLRR